MLSQGLFLQILELIINLILLLSFDLSFGKPLELIPHIIGVLFHFIRRIKIANTGIQLKVHKLNQRDVEIQKSAHNPIVDINGQIWRILIRSYE